jgi:hypothetical protein
MNECKHEKVMFDKMNNCYFCEDCMEVFFEDDYTLLKEEEPIDDELELNQLGLNNL